MSIPSSLTYFQIDDLLCYSIMIISKAWTFVERGKWLNGAHNKNNLEDNRKSRAGTEYKELWTNWPTQAAVEKKWTWQEQAHSSVSLRLIKTGEGNEEKQFNLQSQCKILLYSQYIKDTTQRR